MNLILFDERFESVRLNSDDPRAKHLRTVLCAEVGTLVFIGFVNGPRARAEVILKGPDGSYRLKVIAEEPTPELLPINLLIGLPRPHTARRILFEAASFGVAGMHFFKAKQSEPSYAKSRLWQTDEWRKRIILGVEQAFCTHLPRVEVHSDLQSALAAPQGAFAKIALDNYEASNSLGTVPIASSSSVAIAVGPERGWSAAERFLLRENGWQLAHLGPRVLRTETACVAAIASVASRLSVWKNQTGSSL